MATLKLQTKDGEAWGDTYTFSNTPKVEISAERVAVGDGDLQAVTRTWTITGRLLGEQDALETARDALEAAFNVVDAMDKRLVLVNDDGDGNLDTLVDETYKGLRVVQPVGYPQGAGVQWATLRDYTLACRATTLLDGTAWGGYTTSVTLGMDGQSHKSVAGEYTGPGAQAAATAAKLLVDVVVVTERQTVDDDQKKVQFTYEYIDTDASRDVISWVESISASRAGTDFVHQTVLGGGSPIKQDTVLRPCRITQSGQAVGRSSYPSFPGYAYSNAYLKPESETSKESPKRTADGGLTEYPIRWNYVYEFSTGQALLDPNVPPA